MNMTPEQEQSISLALVKYRPDFIDGTFIKLVITSIKTGTVEFLWTEARFREMLRYVDATGSYEITKPLKEMHFDQVLANQAVDGLERQEGEGK